RGAWRVGEYLDLVRLATITNETMDQSFFGAIGLAETTQAPAGQSSAARNPRAGSADTARSTQQNSYRLQSCPDSKLSIWVCQSCLQNRHCRAFFRSALSVFIRGEVCFWPLVPCLRRSGQTQRTFCPGHVPVASELEAHLAEHADRPEAELLVQF